MRWLRGLTVLGAVLVLGVVNFSIAGKERIKRTGELAYLELAPVDPRSLVQGDYMALRFALVQSLEAALRRPAAGSATPAVANDLPREATVARVPVYLAANHVASLAPTPGSTRVELRYRIRNGAVWLGTNAFFFQEGDAERFNGARYGEFRVDPASGEAVLLGLRDEALKPL